MLVYIDDRDDEELDGDYAYEESSDYEYDSEKQSYDYDEGDNSYFDWYGWLYGVCLVNI